MIQYNDDTMMKAEVLTKLWVQEYNAKRPTAQSTASRPPLRSLRHIPKKSGIEIRGRQEDSSTKTDIMLLNWEVL